MELKSLVKKVAAIDVKGLVFVSDFQKQLVR